MNLKQKLDYHYKEFDKSQISPDPLQFLHLFTNEKDIESIGFIASIFAYGNVTQIINTLTKLIWFMNNEPYEFIINFKEDNNSISGLKHRFYTSNDISVLFSLLKRAYKKYTILKNLFLKFYIDKDKNLKDTINKFSAYFLNEAERTNHLTQGIKFMFPLPELGSACKRMNLFLRWMIRKDELDFGLWNEIPTNKLVIPVDTHVARICRSLKLTKRKNADWKMAEEITERLKKFDPNDPVKYDFAICHIGMRKMDF